ASLRSNICWMFTESQRLRRAPASLSRRRTLPGTAIARAHRPRLAALRILKRAQGCGDRCMTSSASPSSQKPVVLVTGASAGIGEAIARRFASGGFRIVAVARRQERLERLARELGSSTHIEILATDVTAPGAPEKAVDLAIRSFGRLDCLVNNAG